MSALALLSYGDAVAEDRAAHPDRVSYNDLDLSRTSDLATFDARLESAVRWVCRPDYQGGAVKFEYVRRCGLGTRASVVKPRAAAIEASRLRVAMKPLVVASVP